MYKIILPIGEVPEDYVVTKVRGEKRYRVTTTLGVFAYGKTDKDDASEVRKELNSQGLVFMVPLDNGDSNINVCDPKIEVCLCLSAAEAVKFFKQKEQEDLDYD